jgi:hypothetical protein
MPTDEVPADRLSTAEVAKACETTPRLLRQFLRADKRYSRQGEMKGARYDFDPKKLNEIKKHFKAWNKTREDEIETRRQARLAAAKEKASTPAEGTTEAAGDEDKPADDGVAEEVGIA